jgi:hypothetical protein
LRQQKRDLERAISEVQESIHNVCERPSIWIAISDDDDDDDDDDHDNGEQDEEVPVLTRKRKKL